MGLKNFKSKKSYYYASGTEKKQRSTWVLVGKYFLAKFLDSFTFNSKEK